MIILLAVAACSLWFMRYTVFGRSVYAIGSNPVAARLTGIRTKRTIFILFLLSGRGVRARRA